MTWMVFVGIECKTSQKSNKLEYSNKISLFNIGYSLEIIITVNRWTFTRVIVRIENDSW